MLETDTIDRQIAGQQAAIETARAAYMKALAGPREDEIDKAAAIAVAKTWPGHAIEIREIVDHG